MNPQIRWLLRRDMPQIQNMEQDNSAQPWTETRYLHALKRQRCIGLVAQQRQNVVGILIYRARPHRFEIIRLLVAPHNRRQGVGTQFVNILKDQLSQQRRREVAVILSELNLSAQLFLKSQNFQATALLRNHNPDNHSDAYVMRYCLVDNTNSPPFCGKNRLSMSLDIEA